MFHWPLSKNYLSCFRVQSHLLDSGHSLHQLKWLSSNEFRFCHLNLLPSCISVVSRASRETRIWMNNLPTAIPAILLSPLPQPGLPLAYILTPVFPVSSYMCLSWNLNSPENCYRNSTTLLHLFMQQANKQVSPVTGTGIVFAKTFPLKRYNVAWNEFLLIWSFPVFPREGSVCISFYRECSDLALVLEIRQSKTNIIWLPFLSS